MFANKLHTHPNRNLLSHFLIVSFLLFYFLNYFFELQFGLTILLGLLSSLLISLMVIRYKQALLYTLAIIIPLSVPFGIFENSKISMPAELICLLMTLFLISKLLTGSKISTQLLLHPVTLLILADLVWLFLSACFSQMPVVSFKRFIIRACFYSSFYYFFFELFQQNPKHIKKIFLFQVLGLLPVILYSLFRHAKVNFTTMWSELVSSPFYFDHTIYGACLAFFVPFVFIRLFESQNFKQKVTNGLLALLFIISTLLSYSRAAWLSVLIVSFAYGLIYFKVKLSSLLYILLLIGGFLFLNRQKIQNKLEKNQEQSHSTELSSHLKSISNINTDASNKERINRWKCALRMFADKPISGFGPGTYQFFYGKYQRRHELTRISTFTGNKGHAHSEYLNALSETGLPGLLIFLSLIITVIIKCIRLIQNSESKSLRYTAAFIFMGLGTYFIHAFFNGFLEFDKMAMPVYSSFAAIAVLDLQEKSKTSL